tara:strand:+ start:631 stop:1404 length:774 start_codon:yes stop_codon:yes gene_type:complete
MNSILFSAVVIHERFKPFVNRFKYNVLSMFIDYDELFNLSKSIKFFSYNKFNFFSFNEKDHGFRDGRLLKEYIYYFLKKNKIVHKKLKIKILCYPRIFGYVFNPLSIIYCFDENKLIAIFYEVKNTPNEQHTYLFGCNNGLNRDIFKHSCKKVFYVSPFIGMKCNYNFRTKIPDNKVSVFIEVLDNSKNKILFASQNGKKIKFSSISLIKYILINPLIMYKVIFFILYQSVIIMFKGGKYYSRKKKTKDSITFEGNF